MQVPLHIAAIDAGSNAIRLLIARAESPWEIHKLETERYPVRLGHKAFTHHQLDRKTMGQAVQAFRHFRELMDRHNVQKYRAVATSAAREARNRRELLERVWRKCGIRLEVVDDAEESRLVRTAVLAAVGERLAPRLILDLGGGSLELNFMRQGSLQFSAALPVGTVRLMEMFGIRGGMSEAQVDEVRDYVLSMLRSMVPSRPDLSTGFAVACGGNAEALAQIAPGSPVQGMETLGLRRLRDLMWDIVRRGVPARMRAFNVRRDRAEVMGIAAIVLSTLGRWLGLSNLLVPGVGVRDGVLRELIVSHFGSPSQAEDTSGVRPLLIAARNFGRRMAYDARHAEQVRRLSVSLFNQLGPIHRLAPDRRAPLELAAVLHDVGYFISAKGHHKHGEYLIRNAEIPGLPAGLRDKVACLVRYHSKAEPEPHHKLYASLDAKSRREVRALASLLRIVEGLEYDHQQGVAAIDVEIQKRRIVFRVQMKRPAAKALAEARQRARFFEQEFPMKTRFIASRVRSHAGHSTSAASPGRSKPSRKG